MPDVLEYTIVLEEAQDGGWSALAPDLPGLLIAGDTREELLASAPDALATYLEAMRDLGHPVPRPGSRVAQVRVSEGSVQRLGDHAALANGGCGWEIGSNRWPNPEPSAPL